MPYHTGKFWAIRLRLQIVLF